MAKYRFISSVLLCAYAILLAHSIIPHHHYGEIITAQQDDHHDDDHNDIDHNFLGEAFSHFQHDSGGAIVYVTTSSTYEISKISIDKDVVLYTCYIIKLLYKPPIVYYQTPAATLSFLFYLNSGLFRGPPMA